MQIASPVLSHRKFLRRSTDMRRDDTKVIHIGNVAIGGGNPIAIQSMTNTRTEDVQATVNRYLHLRKWDVRLFVVQFLRWKRRKLSERSRSRFIFL